MDDVLVEPDVPEGPVPETEPETPSLTLASLAQTAEVLLKQGGEGIWGGRLDGGCCLFRLWRIFDLGSDRTLSKDFMRYTMLKRKLSTSCTPRLFLEVVFFFSNLHQLQDGPTSFFGPRPPLVGAT